VRERVASSARGAVRPPAALIPIALSTLDRCWAGTYDPPSRAGVALCLEIGDHGTRDLLEKIVVDEEHHIDWIEAQRHKIGEIGYQQYLAQQIYA
jgi:hypothetical protein